MTSVRVMYIDKDLGDALTISTCHNGEKLRRMDWSFNLGTELREE